MVCSDNIVMEKIQIWLKKLLGLGRSAGSNPNNQALSLVKTEAIAIRTGDDRFVCPAFFSKAEIQCMAPFHGLDKSAITVVRTEAEADLAYAVLSAAKIVGFDTESRPTFNKGEHAQGPHLLQFSTTDHAYLFPALDDTVPAALKHLLTSSEVKKVGFDLRSDMAMLQSNFGIECKGIVDLVPRFRKMGYRNTVGAVQAVALVLTQHYRKSKSAKMSNWAALTLSDSQQLYAANDAYVALRIYHALQDNQRDKPRD